jgi:hypothetical protein
MDDAATRAQVFSGNVHSFGWALAWESPAVHTDVDSLSNPYFVHGVPRLLYIPPGFGRYLGFKNKMSKIHPYYSSGCLNVDKIVFAW